MQHTCMAQLDERQFIKQKVDGSGPCGGGVDFGLWIKYVPLHYTII